MEDSREEVYEVTGRINEFGDWGRYADVDKLKELVEESDWKLTKEKLELKAREINPALKQGYGTRIIYPTNSEEGAIWLVSCDRGRELRRIFWFKKA